MIQDNTENTLQEQEQQTAEPVREIQQEMPEMQQEMPQPADDAFPVPVQAPPKKGRFLLGMVVGCALTALIGVFVFALVYPRMQRGGSVSVEDVPVEDRVIDAATSEKLELINAFILERYYKDDVTVDAKREALYRGLVSSLGDVYSVYFNEEEYAALQQQNEGIYYGIGAYVSFNEELNRSYVSGIIPNSPAEEAGLQENDVFWEVDGTSTEGLNTEQVAGMIRGPEYTEVTIMIHRDDEEMTLQITRRRVEHQTVDSRMLEDQIGYIQLAEFDGVTPDQFKTAYDRLQQEGMRALVLDLRANPGGNLAAVCEVANYLLPKGDIVYTVDKYNLKETYSCEGRHEIQIPLAVLVDGHSASAAEILAGAIKDYEKGTLIGTTTFGKGIVQRFFSLGDGTGLKLTISDYYTPKGNNIHKVGITPDVEIEFDADAYEKDKTDNQLDRAVEILLKELQ